MGMFWELIKKRITDQPWHDQGKVVGKCAGNGNILSIIIFNYSIYSTCFTASLQTSCDTGGKTRCSDPARFGCSR